MSEGIHELVLASAGAGKTFRISSRILTLLATGTEPDVVFASTFTRKAAGEILARVLERLSGAADSEEGAHALGKELADLSGQAELRERTRADWQELLARTVRSLHRFDVSTLDAFFSRAVRAFGHELGLPAGWGIADEATAERLRSRALEEVLSGADPRSMTELVRSMPGGELRRSVHKRLADDMDDILRVHAELDPEAPGWDALGRGLGLVDAAGDPVAGAPDDEDLRAEAERLGAALSALELPKTQKGTPWSSWEKARGTLLQGLLGGDWEGLLSQTLVQRVAAGDAKYDRSPIDEDFRSVIGEILDLTRLALGRLYHDRARAMARLAEAYGESLDRILREAGALRFDDVTRLLAGPEELGGREALGYRLDAGLRHLLLDEFQDTSLLQWRALRPLTDRVIRDGGGTTSSSVVADPKQSIYGWRGAAPVIVDTLAEAYEPRQDSLSESWRSSAVVLDVVNRVFETIAANPVFEDKPIDRATADAWSQHFQLHTPARSGLPGHVTLEAGPAKEGRTNLQPALLRRAAERVAELHRTDPARSLGVLVRRKESLARIMYELKILGVEASEEGGTRLVDSPAVVSVLALLRLADHPGNRLARYHVARTPVGAAVGYTDPDDDPGARRASLHLRERLVEDGYGRTLSGLRDDLAGACTPRDLRRLDQLVELGHTHDEAAGLRVDDFVTIAEKARVEAGGDAPVRVMTLWGSKGLEFDAVVLPDLHISMDAQGYGNPPLAWRPTPTERVHHAFPPMKEAVADLFAGKVPTVSEARDQARAADVRDALSGLYVAMTRARYALHMIIPAEPDKASGARSPARLLRHALDGKPEAPTEEGRILYQAGDPEWWRTAPRREGGGVGTGQEDAAPLRLRLARRPHRRLLDRRRPSEHEVALDRLLGLEGRGPEGVPPRVRGSIVHAWMEAVTWLDDGLPDRSERLRLARREVPDYRPGDGDDPLDELWAWVQDRLAAAEIRDALSRAPAREAAGAPGPTASPGSAGPLALEVENELPFLHREGDTLLEGIIDRLVLIRDSEGVVAAHVLDYKTDVVPSGDEAALARLTEHYAPQLRAYRGAVATLYGIPPERVRLTLLFLEPGRAVDVG